jgi:hypothetical protein
MTDGHAASSPIWQTEQRWSPRSPASPSTPVAIDRARIDRQIRELALEHAGGGLGDDTCLTRLKVLREQRDAIVEQTALGLPGKRAVEWLRALGESVQAADLPKPQAYRRRRQTCSTPSTTGSRSPAPRSWESG